MPRTQASLLVLLVATSCGADPTLSPDARPVADHRVDARPDARRDSGAVELRAAELGHAPDLPRGAEAGAPALELGPPAGDVATPSVDLGKPTADLGGPATHTVKVGQAIQPFLDAAKPGDTILLAPGVHTPTAIAEAMLVVRAAKDGITIRGGGKSPEETVLDGKKQVLHVVFLDEGISRKTVIENLTVTGGYAHPGKLFPGGLTPTLRPEVGLSDDFYHDGAGFMLFRAGPTLRSCRAVANDAERCGGGVSVFAYASVGFPAVGPLLEGTVIADNVIGSGTGGGVDVYNGANATIVNTLISGNNGWGAVAVLDGSTASFENVTIADSKSYAIAGSLSANVTITHSIIAHSVDEALHFDLGAKLAVSHSCFFQNGGVPAPTGVAVLTADPLFTAGPRGKHYLSQKAAGQTATSPCVDAGALPAAALQLAGQTTRTDGAGDSGLVDLGYHYPP
jgi:hypothetical protein